MAVVEGVVVAAAADVLSPFVVEVVAVVVEGGWR